MPDARVWLSSDLTSNYEKRRTDMQCFVFWPLLKKSAFLSAGQARYYYS